MKGKILLVIALYTTLGIIGFVNFRLQDYLFELVGWKTSAHETVRQKLAREMTPQTVPQEESQESVSGQEGND